MKQLYSTGTWDQSTTAASARGNLRAATSGMGPEAVESAIDVAHYAPPPARSDDPSRPLPVRLALLQTDAGRVLTHVAPRKSSYFAHTLLNVPATADAQLAIQTWGSPLWQRDEPESVSDLPDLPYLPVADVLDDQALKSWLDDSTHREMLEFVISALLGTPSTTRIVLAASADDVAKVVYAITVALPAGLLSDFTFSTYEPNPLIPGVRLIGHETGAEDWSLPAACFTDGSVAFDPRSGKRSELTVQVPFASYAVEMLAAGNTAALDERKATWQRLGLTDARQFDLVDRLARGTSPLTKDEAATALHYPPLAVWVASKTEVLSQLLEWALDDRSFAVDHFTRAVQAIRQKSDVLAGLAKSVRERGLAALNAGDRTRTANAFEIVLPMVAPTRANAVWGELIDQLADPSSLDWGIRNDLLPKFVRYRQQQGITGVDTTLAKWLDVPADRLADVLALDLPKGYQLAIVRKLLSKADEPSETTIDTLARYPGLVLTILQPDDSTQSNDRRVALFEGLLARHPDRGWFEELLVRSNDYPASLLNRFFEATLSAGKIDADRLVRSQGSHLLELFAGETGLDRLGTEFLANPPVDLLQNSSLLEFLGRLKQDTGCGATLAERITTVQTVKSYLDQPSFDGEVLKTLSDALVKTPSPLPTATRSTLFATTSEALAKSSNQPELQDHLESALIHLGPVLAHDSVDLYENFLREIRTRTDLFRPNVVQTFLAVALGASRSPELGSIADRLDGHALNLASEAARKGGSRLLDDVDKRTSTWPKSARTQWGFLLAAVRPPRIKQSVRDLLMAALGAAIASGIWWGVATFLR